MTTRYRLGIDAGGTFTDFLLVGSDGSRLAHKTSSVPLDPPRAVATGLAEMAEGLGVTPSELAASIDTIVHGTTVATNAVLTRNGAVGGVLCTEGFRDTLDLGDGTRPDPYDNRVPAPRSSRWTRSRCSMRAPRWPPRRSRPSWSASSTPPPTRATSGSSPTS